MVTPQHLQRNRERRKARGAAAVAAVVLVGVTAAWAWGVFPVPAPMPKTVAAAPTSISTPSHSVSAAVYPTKTAVDSPTSPDTNWVVVENGRPGSTEWQIDGTPPGVLAGFADHTSAHLGDTVTLYVTTDAPTFEVQAFRMGYYQGDGARLVWTSSLQRGTTQPDCPVTPVTNMVACDNWSPSLPFVVTPTFVQGDYLLKLVGSGGQASYIPLTITDPSSQATFLVKNDIYTWQAWNPYGGNDFYAGLGRCAPTYPPCNRARVVSFDRPYGYVHGAGDFLGQEYPLVRFMEEHGLDVTYATDVDVDQNPAIALAHKAVLSLGHDECWSLVERQAVQAAVAQGVNVVFFGASPVLRHVRPQSSPIGADREVVDYRDSAEDPVYGTGNPLEVTGNTWSAPPANWSEVPFVGSRYTGYLEPGGTAVGMIVTDASSWIYAGTGLQDGSVIDGLIFGDFDQYAPGESPTNVQIFAHTPMRHRGVQTSSASPASDITYYTDPSSGAGVFDTGSTTWIPVLQASAVLQQMTGNLLTVFGQGPAGRTQPSVANWQQFYY